MKNKQIITIVAIAILCAGGGFYGGMTYAKNKALSPGDFQDLTSQQRQQMFGQNGTGANLRGRVAGAQVNGGFTGGEILSQDDKSITIKTRDGSSKIVYFSGTTQILKSIDGQKGDLAIGKQVSISGITGSDGTITAQSISIQQIVPVTPAQNK